MKYFLILICLLFSAPVFADTTLSRDGDGQKVNGGAFGSIRNASVGTKGFKCFSTTTRMSWEVKVVDASGNQLPFKYFLNEVETSVYTITDKMFQFQNAPTSKSPTVTKACLRKYSSATAGTAQGIFQ